jgi:hypothetical protein
VHAGGATQKKIRTALLMCDAERLNATGRAALYCVYHAFVLVCGKNRQFLLKETIPHGLKIIKR